jgi:outer membrane protein
MNKKVLFLLMLLGTTVFSLNIVAQELWSLEKCIVYAFENNLQIQQSQLDVLSADQDLRQSKLNMVPSFNAGFNHNFGWGRYYDDAQGIFIDNKSQQNFFSINSDLTLFQGLSQLNNIKQKNFDYLAKKYDSDKIKNDISLYIAASYLSILFNLELVNNAQRQVDISKEQIDRTEKQVDAGAVARGSLYDIQAQGAGEEATLINTKNNLMLAYLDLMQLLDLEASKDFDIEKPKLEITGTPSLLSPEMIYNKALTLMPEIKSAEYRLNSAEKSLSGAKGYHSPRIYASGSYGTNFSNQIGLEPYQPISEANPMKSFDQQWIDNRNGGFRLGISIPIFNGYQVSTNVQKSKIYKDAVNLNLEIEKNTLRKNIETAYADAIAAYQTYIARKKSVDAFHESFKYIGEKFEVGMVTSTDYNVAKIQLNNAESDLASSKYDYIFKVKILDFYLGKSLSLADIAGVIEE